MWPHRRKGQRVKTKCSWGRPAGRLAPSACGPGTGPLGRLGDPDGVCLLRGPRLRTRKDGHSHGQGSRPFLPRCLMPRCVGTGDVLAFSIGGAEVRSKGGRTLSFQNIPHSLLSHRPLKSSLLHWGEAQLGGVNMHFACVAVCGRRASSRGGFPSTSDAPRRASQAPAAATTRAGLARRAASFLSPLGCPKRFRQDTAPAPGPALTQATCLNDRRQQLWALPPPDGQQVISAPREGGTSNRRTRPRVLQGEGS